MDELASQLFDISTLIPDQKYVEIMETFSRLNNTNRMEFGRVKIVSMETLLTIDTPGYHLSLNEDGCKVLEMWHKNHSMLHRDGDKPAFILYNPVGNKVCEKWLQDGKMHRDGDKPALIIYNEVGSKILEEWYQNGKIQRERSTAN